MAVRAAQAGAEPVVPARPSRVRALRRRPAVYAVLLAYAVVSTVLMLMHDVGVTSEHALLIVLVLFALVAPARPFVWDWLPFLGVGVMFSDLGTMIGKDALTAHTVAPITTEQALLGGNVATVWLQQHAQPAVAWLDAPLAAVYLSFFMAPMGFGLWLWWRRRDRFGLFVTAYIAMMAMGFLVYVLYPEAPPWLAAKQGLLPHVDRITVSLLDHLGAVGRLYGGADPAPAGAMPSLHVAVPALIAATMIGMPGRRRTRRWLWALYPVTMAFATLWLGEHYLLDAVAGIVLGVLCFIAATFVHARRRPGLRARPRLPAAPAGRAA